MAKRRETEEQAAEGAVQETEAVEASVVYPTYVVAEDVSGAIGSEAFSYPAGPVVPANRNEMCVLEHLVHAGAAKLEGEE